jgi:hypothetical protein
MRAKWIKRARVKQKVGVRVGEVCRAGSVGKWRRVRADLRALRQTRAHSPLCQRQGVQPAREQARLESRQRQGEGTYTAEAHIVQCSPVECSTEQSNEAQQISLQTGAGESKKWDGVRSMYASAHDMKQPQCIKPQPS